MSVLRLAVALGFASMVGVVQNDSIRAQPPRQAFRVGVDLVSLNVTVVDGSQRYIQDLRRDDFLITENGIPQEVTFFAKTDVPLALALLIDTSASMEESLRIAQEAAIGFVRQIGPMDLATIIDFDSRVQTAQSLTSDQAALETAIRQTVAEGSTALYNAVYIALKELGKLTNDDPQAPRRRAIIVLSDGDDTSSLVSFDEVLDLASRADIVIYTIGLGRREAVGSQDGQFVLRRLAHQTGGRAFFPDAVRDLAAIYRDIREELASQYSLAYESSSTRRDGQWRRVAVRVNRPSVMVRTRQGYFAPTQ